MEIRLHSCILHIIIPYSTLEITFKSIWLFFKIKKSQTVDIDGTCLIVLSVFEMI